MRDSKLQQSFGIRHMAAADAGPVYDLVHQLASSEGHSSSVRSCPKELYDNYLAACGELICLVAFDKSAPERVIGFLLAEVIHSSWVGKRAIFLDDLYVVPDSRHLGIGSSLMEELICIAKKVQCLRIEWRVQKENKKALNFYLAAGADILDEWQFCRLEL